MATNYVQDGDTIDYTNGTGSYISSGDIVVIGGTLGVALVDIANGESGTVGVKGVYTVPKVSAAVFSQGASLTYDVSASAFDDNAATPATGDITGPAARAHAAGANGETTAEVYFTGVPGTVN